MKISSLDEFDEEEDRASNGRQAMRRVVPCIDVQPCRNQVACVLFLISRPARTVSALQE